MTAHLAACGVVTLAILGTLATAAARDPKPVEIRLRPAVVLAGGAFWLTCRVQRHPQNRKLLYGVVDYRASERQVDGEDAPITFPPVLVEHIPCHVGPAYCVIARADGQIDRAVQEFPIGGCDP